MLTVHTLEPVASWPAHTQGTGKRVWPGCGGWRCLHNLASVAAPISAESSPATFSATRRGVFIRLYGYVCLCVYVLRPGLPGPRRGHAVQPLPAGGGPPGPGERSLYGNPVSVLRPGVPGPRRGHAVRPLPAGGGPPGPGEQSVR